MDIFNHKGAKQSRAEGRATKRLQGKLPAKDKLIITTCRGEYPVKKKSEWRHLNDQWVEREEGYQRLTYMMLDENVVAVSPSTPYRVLKADWVAPTAEQCHTEPIVDYMQLTLHLVFQLNGLPHKANIR